jgi:hypothetical protein
MDEAERQGAHELRDGVIDLVRQLRTLASAPLRRRRLGEQG